MHVMHSDGSHDRTLTDSARAYFEDRATVWLNDHELVYIDHGGLTQQLDVRNGKHHPLLNKPSHEHGWLINATRAHATTGQPTFSLYNAGKQEITPQGGLPGCQPYFTHDGRWGFWMGGAGGPINRFNLHSRQASPILNPHDPRMPKDRNYLYFPMVSRNGRLFACGASPGQHDHFTSDYDIFVCPINPETLELIGNPVRYTFHSGNDRFPDVFLADLELGRHAGEAPFTVTLSPMQHSANWHWEFGDGGKLDAPTGKHTFAKPGEYRVNARQGDRTIRGLVTVRPAAPPKIVHADLQGDRQIRVEFDEPVDAAHVQAHLDSGVRVTSSMLDADAQQLVLELSGRLTRADKLHLEGITDRAQKPNRMSPQTIPVQPASWPVNREGLVFVFETADKPNQIPGRNGQPPRSYPLRPRGRARPDHDQALIATGGAWLVEGADESLLNACRQTNQLTIEAVIRPDHLRQQGPARIVTFSTNAGTRNFTLGQQDDTLVLRLRTPKTGENGVNPETRLAPIPADKPTHVVVTYRPGEMVAYYNGREVYRGQAVTGDFQNWGPQHLLLGDELDGQRDWAGTLEGVAIYNRVLAADEVRRNATQYLSIVRSRKPVPRIGLTARLLDKSPAPTLAEIKPYRSALMMSKYRVTKVTSGKLDEQEILVAQWALLDGQPQPIATLAPGGEVHLELEPFEQNPQLQRFVCKDGFDSDTELLLPRYCDVTP
jgi:hypothetical protein